VAAATAVAAA